MTGDCRDRNEKFKSGHLVRFLLLNYFGFGYNRFTSLPHMCKVAPHLQTLDLKHYTRLKSIEPFKNQLRSLMLDGLFFYCDCQVLWIIQILIKQKSTGPKSVFPRCIHDPSITLLQLNNTEELSKEWNCNPTKWIRPTSDSLTTTTTKSIAGHFYFIFYHS